MTKIMFTSVIQHSWYSSSFEENCPKTDTSAIGNFRYMYRICDFILGYLPLLSLSSYYYGFNTSQDEQIR